MEKLAILQAVRKEAKEELNNYFNKCFEALKALELLLKHKEEGQSQEQLQASETVLQGAVTEMESVFDIITTKLSELEEIEKQTHGTLHKSWVTEDMRNIRMKRRQLGYELNALFVRKMVDVRLKEEMTK